MQHKPTYGCASSLGPCSDAVRLLLRAPYQHRGSWARKANGPERSQSSTTVALDTNKPFLEVQPSRENTQHVRAYGPALLLCPLMNACCLLSGTAYDQGRSISHYGFISYDINIGKDLANPETTGYRVT
jgi:hypothetical protein